MKRAPILLFFFFSGSSGLIYEVVWTRLFEFVIGSSHSSMAIVVSTFMGGLALGSVIGGRLADRSRSPLRLYGYLVLLTGLFCILIPTLIQLANPLFGMVYRLHDGQPSNPLFIGVKLLASVGILLVPTTFMGATLPALTRHLTRGLGEVGSRLGRRYAANTLGAVAGAWTAGFFLIPRIGLWGSSALAAGIDALVGVAVIILVRQEGWAAAPAGTPKIPQAEAPEAPVPQAIATVARPGLVVVAFGVSGMVDMMLQLAWTRSLILTLGNSTYAFSVIVGIFILGLSGGSMIASLFADRLRSPQAALGWTMAAVSALSCLTIPALGIFAPEFSHWLANQRIEMTFPVYLGLGALWAAVLIFPATLFMGMTFPLVGRLAVRALENVGRTIGWAYFANTFGSIVGTLLVGFVLLPLTGTLWAPLYLAVALGLAAALVLVILDPSAPARRVPRLALCGAVLAVLGAFSFLTRPWGVADGPASPQRYWDPNTLSMGPFYQYRMGGMFPTVSELEKFLREQVEILYYKDGEAASVGVFRVRGTNVQTLRICGKPEASSGTGSVDMPTQLLSGHLPLLACPSARTVINIGLGSGISLGAMTLYPQVERFTFLEICPEVLEAARFFGEANHGCIGNPKVTAIVGDGRNHLQHTSLTYDVISSEPSNFWIAGLGNLFTSEFYELVKRRLKPGGVVCQWVQSYLLRLNEFQIALRTFSSAFPHVSLWTPGGDVLFIGSLSPIEWRGDWIATCLKEPAIAADLASIGIDRPEALFRYLRLEDDGVRRLAGKGPENRDLFPYLEYLAPLGLFKASDQVPSLVCQAAASPLKGTYSGFSSPADLEVYRRRGIQMYLLIDAMDSLSTPESFEQATDLLLRIIAEKDPWMVRTAAVYLKPYAEMSANELWSLFYRRVLLATSEPEFVQSYQSLKGIKLSQQLIEQAARLSLPTDWTAHIVLAQEAANRGDAQAVLNAIQTAAQRGAPGHLPAQVRGVLEARQGNLAAAEASVREALALAPPGQKREILFIMAFLREKQGDYEKAVEYNRQSLAEGADPVRGGVSLARCLRAAGKPAEALEAAKASAAKRATVEACYEAARALMDLGSLEEALGYMTRAATGAPGRYDKELQSLKAALKK